MSSSAWITSDQATGRISIGISAPPLDSVLDGITRRVVLDAADDAGIPIEIRPVAWSEVVGADELILTSTTHPVVPVGRLDDQAFEAPGPVAMTLGRAMAAIFRGEHPISGRWLTPLLANAVRRPDQAVAAT